MTRPPVARFTSAQLQAFNGAPVDDVVAPHLRLLFVGINPGLWTAAVNAHFARRGNRFWPALHRAGITPHLVDAANGMNPADLAMVQRLGIGITNVVPTASARADELTRAELRAGGVVLEAKVAGLHPKVVAVLGLTVYRQAFDRPKAVAGRQPERLAGAELWVLPNPSGLNAHDTVDTLAVAYRAAWDAANA
jgi:double-stranded uracil-DNA glycosylase